LKAIDSKASGADLVITFAGENGLTHHDYDFKLLGRTQSDDLVVGYALLPGKSPMDASLIVLPNKIKEADDKTVLECDIENAGLSDSKPQEGLVYAYSSKGRRLHKALPIPSIKPYASHKISVEINATALAGLQYEIVIPGTPGEYWKTVDLTDDSVTFTGSWKSNPKPDKKCFLNTEMLGTAFGDTVIYTFHGTRARAYGRTGRPVGTFDVFFDGQYMDTVHGIYSNLAHEKIFQTPRLPDGKHTLKLVKIKTDRADYNADVYIDSFSFESERNHP